MAIVPVITNRAPADGSVAGVEEGYRFSARDQDQEVDRLGISFYLGSGPAFYQAAGGVLPEENESIQFLLRPWSAFPSDLTEREVLTTGFGELLRITKQTGTNARGLYEFGGLQSPADPDAPLMLEFTVKIAQAGVVTDAQEWSGVMAGFKINDTGIVVKFHTDGATRRVELHDAQVSTVAPPSPSYSAEYDWDQGVPHTYKLLWFPAQDRVHLYVSSGVDQDPDILLIDGAVSDFPGPLAPNETPVVQPVAFFGHGSPTAQSTTGWASVYFYNIVTAPILDGVYRGQHNGFLRTDNVVTYVPTRRPQSAEQPWIVLPDSFGTIEGSDETAVGDLLRVYRPELAASYGFLRYEPRLGYAGFVTIYDVQVAGQVISRDPNLGEATGMEIFIDDGSKKAVIGLLDVAGSQSLGLLTTGDPSQAASYVGLETSWSVLRTYRIIFDPSGDVRVFQLAEIEEGVEEVGLFSAAYSALPASSYPGPGLGFLNNANTIAARTILTMGRVRYSTEVTSYEGELVPIAPWTADGGGSESSDGEDLTVVDDVANDHRFFEYGIPQLDSENGTFVEFRAKVSSYTFNGLSNPVREVTGVGATIDDGTFQHMLFFADAGPDLGRIIVLATNENLRENLLDIRAGKEEVAGTYAQVDWTIFHLYRLERTTGGDIQVFIDDNTSPVISFPTGQFTSPPTTGGTKSVRFGSFMDDRSTESVWRHVRFGISGGYDVSGFPILSENEVLSRFDHAVNVIAHVQDTDNIAFAGVAGSFDAGAQDVEDFEDLWPDAGGITTSFAGVPGQFNA